MYFLIENDDLVEKYNTIWDKVSPDIKKELDNEPVCNICIYIYIFLENQSKPNLMAMKLQIFTLKNS